MYEHCAILLEGLKHPPSGLGVPWGVVDWGLVDSEG